MVKRSHIMLFFIAMILILGITCIAFIDTPHSPVPHKEPAYFKENFDAVFLDTNVWALTQEGDVKARVTDVFDVDPTEDKDYRLRLGLNTLGTRDDTVKFQGIRSMRAINLSDGDEISFDVDWNNQSNGCYLTASFYLCPTATDGNPEDEDEWLKFEYIGVPPGYNARSVIASKGDGRLEYLYTDGWPDQKIGRPIGNQRIRILIHDGQISVLENGSEVYKSEDPVVAFSSAFIYLQMSSHSNYPLREIYFDDIVAQSA
jgi:hypothetical protein